jgi:hypothetical protein
MMTTMLATRKPCCVDVRLFDDSMDALSLQPRDTMPAPTYFPLRPPAPIPWPVTPYDPLLSVVRPVITPTPLCD